MMLKRTAKSCRSDAPMLASSLREGAQATVSNKPGHRGEREVSRKTIARGMPGDFRCDRGDYARVFVFYHTRGCGCIERPAFPAPSIVKSGETVFAKLGRIAPRDRGGVFLIWSALIAIEAKQSTARATVTMDCFFASPVIVR